VLIEDLIRLGRPLLDGDMKAEELLRLITDVSDDRVKNFYRNVFVVVLPGKGDEPMALGRQVFGSADPDKNDDFTVDGHKALGVPITLPSGGNPLNPQGRYGLPVYPLYDPHIRAFRESVQGVDKFLEGRLARTENCVLDTATRQKIAQALHASVLATVLDPKKNLGVLVLAQCDGSGFFRLDSNLPVNRIGEWTGRAIVPNYDRILPALWEAKIEEGRGAGARPGPCSIDGTGNESVSAYCKAWPWAFPTWTCPLPDGGDETKLVEGIALSRANYRALVLGACVFIQLTQRLSPVVVPEIFSPVGTRPGKEQAQRRNLSDLPTIVGSAFLLPVQDDTLNDPEHRFEFVHGIRKMLAADPKDATQAERYLTAVVGFDVFLPDDLKNLEDYRLTLVYFSGDYTRGDVKLRAFIQDVVPSKLSRLRTLAKGETVASMTLLRQLLPAFSDKQYNWYASRYDSVPWLLARAYGGAYLWSQLESLLHGRHLSPARVTTNLARRLESLVPSWRKSHFAISEEVAFYLNVLRFLDRVNQELVGPSEEFMPMRNWKEMLRAVDTGPVEDLLTGEPSAAELGFASGAIIRRFSRRYYVGMRRSKPDADFLRDRVLTFGSSLRWDAVQHRALRFINELPNNQLKKQIKFSRDLGERAAAISDALRRNAGAVERNKDEFLTAFWCGYALQGYEKSRTLKTKKTIPQLQE
jgi:hypothetical protein